MHPLTRRLLTGLLAWGALGATSWAQPGPPRPARDSGPPLSTVPDSELPDGDEVWAAARQALAQADTEAAHPALRHTPEADAQGLDRFARGQYFFARAGAAAAAIKTPFHWTLATAPGIAHSNKGMAPFAARILFPD